MQVIDIVFIAFGLAMDAFAVSICRGLKVKKVSWKYSVSTAFVFGLFQALMPLVGYLAGKQFESYITGIDHWIAFILLGLIGGKMLIESIKDIKSGGETNIKTECEIDEFSYKKLIILAIATSIDALAVGISFAVLNVSIIPSIITIGITTFVLSFFAVFLGKKLGEYMQNYAELLGGIILIFIGAKILIEHLSGLA